MAEQENKVVTTTEEQNNETAKNAVKTEKKREKLKIRVKSHETFGNEGIKTEFLTSVDLCQKISTLFGEMFIDYVGAKIQVNDGRSNVINKYVGPIGIPYVELYFKYVPKRDENEKACRALTFRGDSEGRPDDMGKRLMNTIGTKSVTCYSITQDIEDVVEDFIRIPSFGGSKINWGEIVSEVQEPMNLYNDRNETLVCITGLSLKALVEMYYGSRADDNSAAYDYEINVVNRIMTYGNVGSDANYIFAINQLNNNLVHKLNKQLGRTSAMHPYQEYIR